MAGVADHLTRTESEDGVAGKSVFDAHHPPSNDLINECVHCGFCLPTCPTYLLWREEMDSPRGRIYLMKMGNDAQVAAMDGRYVAHFDKCLGCMACMTACPSGVKYDKLIEATRAQVERHYSRSFWDRLFRSMIFLLFPHPKRLRAAMLPMWLYQRLGLRWLSRKTGLLRLLPQRLQSMEALMPNVSLRMLWSDLPARIAAVGPVRKRVGLLLGCVQRVFFDDVNAATARVLAAEGCEVIIPRGQGCCGALMTHAGREEQAISAARKLIDTFERANVDTIVINAAGCGSNMKEYGHLLRDDPKYAERAKEFAVKCKDISEVLGELEPRAVRHPIEMRVAYHDSCHLQHAQGIRMQPRDLLKTIPGLELVEIPEAAICCGSAGIYNLVEPGPAEELGDRKVGNIITTGAEALVSGNPGCTLQIASGLKRAGRSLPVLHTIELLDYSIQGRGIKRVQHAERPHSAAKRAA
jgi:glycolate oxidase iron-sulfur subunit